MPFPYIFKDVFNFKDRYTMMSITPLLEQQKLFYNGGFACTTHWISVYTYKFKIKNNAEGVIVDKHLNGFLRVKIEGPKKDESDQREGLKPEDAKIRDLPMDHVHLKEHVDLMTTYFDTLCFTLLFFSYLIFTAVSTKVMDFFGQEYIYVHDHYGTDATVEGIGTLPRECEGDPYEGMQFGVSGSFPETKACELKVLMCVLRADYSTRCDSKVYT